MRITRPYRWATWGAITGWVGYGWSEPTSYSYGETVYYEGDTVYQGDQVVASAEEYTQQAEDDRRQRSGGRSRSRPSGCRWASSP